MIIMLTSNWLFTRQTQSNISNNLKLSNIHSTLMVSQLVAEIKRLLACASLMRLPPSARQVVGFMRSSATAENKKLRDHLWQKRKMKKSELNGSESCWELQSQVTILSWVI